MKRWYFLLTDDIKQPEYTVLSGDLYRSSNASSLDTLPLDTENKNRPSAVFDHGVGNFEPQTLKRVALFPGNVLLRERAEPDMRSPT